ncbi:hypothetical protein OG613_18085 [Streptomyces sp. NBC_00015]|uniref:hypothetical protein n=1 Tax=unclassified Streptomyces TaxID=2593676 RepID=UPI002258E40C|nr:hypothetical protein [Streptomyces sp. NBC_00103]MCX5369723.1 hypothetical protein [Streptomyces sp. NBC_00103]
MPSSRATPEPRPGDDRSTDLIRWAAFSCFLVPVVLLWYGTSLAGATGTALGLAAVTAVCRVLLRRSERCAARLLDEEPAPQAHPRGRHQRTGTGSHRGGRHSGGNSPVG